MKKIISELIVCLAAITCVADVFAETSACVTVTFSIPVMPGLNAPLIEKEEIKAEPQKQDEEKQVDSREETKPSEPQLIQQDSEDAQVLVKTFYSP
ncbi:MAG: hypothetical protein NC916_03525 [Candidatus Omnitrophica bacterium]|nr:hypothetical protein [Candidatus Omnitrophota bacterium]